MYKIVVVVLLFVAAMSSAQETSTNESSQQAQMVSSVITPKDTKAKKFRTFDTQTKVELGLAFASIAADGYTTVWNGGKTSRHDLNPIIGSRNGNATFDAFYFAGSAASLVGSNYMLRKHPRIKHVLNWSVIGVESFWVYKNTTWHRR